MKLTNKLLFMHLFAGASIISQAQDSSLAQLRKDLVGSYTTSLGHDANLYNGMEYFEYSHTIRESHPFFIRSNYDTGSVTYDGLRYDDVPLIYDVVTDELVIQHPRTLMRMQLHKDLVEGFEIEGHRFVHLKKDSAAKSMPSEGFYELSYDGNVKVLTRHTKALVQRTTNVDIYKIAVPKEYYYVFKKGTYHFIRNERALLDVLKEKRSEVSQHLRKNGLRFRKQKEETLKAASSFYDQLSR